MMRKVSREELAPVAQRFAQIEQMLQRMQTHVVPQVQAVAHRQQMSAEQAFWADLTTMVPNFRDINGNEESTGQAAVAQSNGRASTSELERQVAPGRTKSTGTPSSNKGKTYSPNDIQKFFDDVRSGKYKGREQERDRTERDIFAAQRENRIIANA